MHLAKLPWLVIVAGCGREPARTPPAQGSAAPQGAAASAPSPAPAPADATPTAEANACAIAMQTNALGTWIGTAVGSCQAPRARGRQDVSWVEAELKQLRAALPTCSAPLVVNGDGASYQDVIELMDMAVKVGFVEVALADKSELFTADSAAPSHCAAPPAPPTKPVPPEPPPPPVPWSPDEARRIAARLQAQVPLPPAANRELLAAAPVIVVTKTELEFGELIVPVDLIPRSEPSSIKSLHAALVSAGETTEKKLTAAQTKACEDAKRGVRPAPGSVCPRGLAILQADASTPGEVIHTIIRTAQGAGFDNLLFAVKNK